MPDEWERAKDGDRGDLIDRLQAENAALAAEVSALRAALERIAAQKCIVHLWLDGQLNCPACLARDALGRYPKEASDG